MRFWIETLSVWTLFCFVCNYSFIINTLIIEVKTIALIRLLITATVLTASWNFVFAKLPIEFTQPTINNRRWWHSGAITTDDGDEFVSFVNRFGVRILDTDAFYRKAYRASSALDIQHKNLYKNVNWIFFRITHSWRNNTSSRYEP